MTLANSFSSTVLCELNERKKQKERYDISKTKSYDSVPSAYKLPLKLTEKYEITSQVLGKGTSCTVKKCLRRSDEKEFAIKIMSKSNLSHEDIYKLKQEILILKRLKNKKSKYTINIIDEFETSKQIFIILELCYENNLFQVLLNNYRNPDFIPDEDVMALIFYQIVKAVHVCHKNDVIHRDVKPENILFKTSKDTHIALSDFGLSKIGKSKHLTKCGSPTYVAPEVILSNNYNSKCDWWSCGVCLFIMLSGSYPFCDDNRGELYKKIVKAKYDFSNPRWKNISKEGKHLVSKLLDPNPKTRYGYRGIMNHPFIRNNLQVTTP